MIIDKRNGCISIIGFGATGVIFFSQLIDKCKEVGPIFSLIYIIDKNYNSGGFAYSTTRNSHILNMSSGTMSAAYYDPYHFYKWVETAWPSKSKNCYLPRTHYCKYLQYMHELALQSAKDLGIEVRIFREDAFDIQAQNQKFVVHINNSDAISSDYIILCIGGVDSDPYSLGSSPGHIKNPYSIKNRSEILAQTLTPILGTGLTAVDAIFTLDELGSNSKIQLFSRHGWLPLVKNDSTTDISVHALNVLRAQVQSLSKSLTADILVEIIRDYILVQTGDNMLQHIPSTNNPIAQIEISLEKAISGKYQYQNILLHTADIMSLGWHYLPQKQKQIFDKKYLSTWNLLRHPMPMQNAQKLLNILQNKGCSLHSNIANVKYQYGGFYILNTSKDVLLKSKSIINCTGLTYDFIDNKLISSMIRNRLAIPHPSGGIYVDFKTNKIKGANCNNKGTAYAIGALTRGTHFYTSAIERSVVRCNAAIQNIINEKMAQNG